MKRMSRWQWVTPFILTAVLITGQVAAQGVDPKSEKELTTLGEKIDRAGASAEAGHVTSKIVDQWKGTAFKFEAGSAPRELTAQDVQNLRQKRLGYGEISILLALTANQPNATTTGKSMNEILAMRKAGEGWGKLAKELGYANLGAVTKSVKATDKGVEKVTVSAQTEKADKVSKADKPDKPEKPEKPMKPEKPERPEKPGR